MLLEFTCPADTSICPATLLNKVELHCEDSPQNYLAARGKLRSCFACQIVVFCQIHLQRGKRLFCMPLNAGHGQLDLNRRYLLYLLVLLYIPVQGVPLLSSRSCLLCALTANEGLCTCLSYFIYWSREFLSSRAEAACSVL